MLYEEQLRYVYASHYVKQIFKFKENLSDEMLHSTMKWFAHYVSKNSKTSLCKLRKFSDLFFIE